MSGIEISELNYEKLCRTCLKEEDDIVSLEPIFNGNSKNFIDIIDGLVLMKLKVKKDDGLPQSICNECVDCLTYLSTFRKLCEKSHKTLESFRPQNSDEILSEELLKTNDVEYSSIEFLYKDENDDDVVDKTDDADVQDNSCSSDENEWNQIEVLSDNDVIDKRKQDKTCDKPISTNDVCFRCGKVCFNADNLKSHQINNCESLATLRCRFCNQVHDTIELLDAHMIDAHPRKRTHPCIHCGKFFSSASNLKTHIESHSVVLAYKCDECDSAFKCKNYLSKHKRLVHTMGNHECPHCSRKFNNTNKYKYHLKTHDPNKKHKCKYCDKSFLQRHHLANHERIHTGARPYLCNICGKDFKQESNFKLHLRIHNGVRPYTCTTCGKGFAQRGSLILHLRQHSGVRPYQCEHCGKNFYQISSLNVHLRTHTGERPFNCDSCDKTFSQAPQLKYHKIAVHGGSESSLHHKKTKETLIDSNIKSLVDISSSTELNEATRQNQVEGVDEISGSSALQIEENGKKFLFKCPLCIKEFKLPSSLTSHMKKHDEERKHVCDECGSKFKRMEHLKIHINGVHLKQKPYSCEICHKTFSQSGDRNVHMLMHSQSEDKLHTCPHCSKNFRLQKALRAHIRIHTGEKPYTCEICSRSFITYNALAAHTVKHSETLLSLAKEKCLKQFNNKAETIVPSASAVALKTEILN